MQRARGGGGSDRGRREASGFPHAGARVVVDAMLVGAVWAAVLVLALVPVWAAMAFGSVVAARHVVLVESRRRGWSAWRLLRSWPSQDSGFDGAVTGGSDMMSPEQFEVFDPAWWQLARWWRWLFALAPKRGSVTLVNQSGEFVQLRAMSVRYIPPSPKRRYVDEE